MALEVPEIFRTLQTDWLQPDDPRYRKQCEPSQLTRTQFEKIRQRHFFNLEAGRKVIRKRNVGFVGMSRQQAHAKAREEGQHWA